MANNLLSKSQIEDLLINVLGCTNVKGWKQDKISCCCPVHGEKNPSFGINCNYVPEGSSEVLQVFNCFGKDTKVITSKGVLPISDLLNAPCSIINGKGAWETVQFKSFGFSGLMKVVLTSNGKEKVVYATPNHRWFVQKRKSVVLTCELKPKQRLERMWLKQPKEFVLNKEALLHGFIYGDGTRNKKVKTRKGYFNHTVFICDDVKYKFCVEQGFDIKPPSPSCTDVIKGRITHTCTYNAKDIPTCVDDLDYIFSFLAGYFVADGNCSHQAVTLSSAYEEELTKIKHLFTILGIATYPIRKQVRTSSSNMGVVSDKKTHIQYILGIVKSTIPPTFWVSDKHPNYGSTYNSYLGYTVKSVEFTNRIEKVYCCQTSTGSFVLDGFILTGNCFSCGASGSLPRLLLLSQPERFTSFANAVNFLENRYGVAYGKVYKNKRSKVRIRRYGEIVEETGKKTLPKVTLALYKSGKETYTYFFNRGFDEADMKEYMIGRDIENKTVTIPVFWEDKTLAGVIGRYISKNRKHNERYRIYEFEKSKVLFPLDKLEVKDSTIILVESQFDVMMMRKWGIKNVLATMGGTISKAQSDIVASKCSKVILLFDNDEGGKKVVERAKSLLKGKVRFLPFQYPDISLGKDPSEWGKEETLKILSSVGKVHVNRL